MIQSWLSAWIVRGFISHSLHSVVASFVMGDFVYLTQGRKVRVHMNVVPRSTMNTNGGTEN